PSRRVARRFPCPRVLGDGCLTSLTARLHASGSALRNPLITEDRPISMGLGRNKRRVCRVRHTSDTAETQLSLNAGLFPDDDGPELTVYPVCSGTERRASGAHLPHVRFRFCLGSPRAPLGFARRILFSGELNTGKRARAEVAMVIRNSGAD